MSPDDDASESEEAVEAVEPADSMRSTHEMSRAEIKRLLNEHGADAEGEPPESAEPADEPDTDEGETRGGD